MYKIKQIMNIILIDEFSNQVEVELLFFLIIYRAFLISNIFSYKIYFLTKL